jgi:hypothetical protein
MFSRWRLETKKSNILSVPAVLKVSKREFAEKEITNYQRYVKWGVPYLWRVDVLGTGFTKHFGAIAYSFVMSGLQKFEALTQYIRDGNEKIIKNALERLFSPEMKRWYGEELICDEENINKRYSQRYFRGSENKNDSAKRFDHVVQREFGARIAQDHILVDGVKLAKPLEIFFGRPHGRYKSCICHVVSRRRNPPSCQGTGTADDFSLVRVSRRPLAARVNDQHTGAQTRERNATRSLGVIPLGG